MKKRILLIASILYVMNAISTKAQTITAPTGQNLTIANSVNVIGGSVNIKADSAFKIGGKAILKINGYQNIFLGDSTGIFNTGANNTFVGKNAGFKNISGFANMFLGSFAGYKNISGAANTFIGVSAGEANTTGGNNLYIGTAAGADNLGGNGGTFIGVNSGRHSTSDYNSFLGAASGDNITSGTNNSGIGVYAGKNLTTGSNNTFIGYSSGVLVGAQGISNATAIGANATVSASNSVVLGNNANVGIGTTAPANKLEVVAAAGQSGLRLKGLAGMSGTLQVNAAGDVILVGAGARMAAATDDANWTLSSNYLYNNSNGVVIGEGISSLPAGYKLFVSDGILTEKVKVAVKNGEDWADRVFEDNYKMLSLAQTNQYIKENKHLPGVPSTQEMIEKGNDLHKTDVILLTKIEELYRHVIKIEQENQALKKELKSLKNRKR
ncbi:MAG: bZIP transcription factor [Flectobacillus sp.]|nr:bZIP transcription factor [Flectobacillus sp.]